MGNHVLGTPACCDLEPCGEAMMTTETPEKVEHPEVVRAEQTRSGRCYRPDVDIVETAGELTIHADIPGVSRDDIDIDFENGVLSIRGNVRDRELEGVDAILTEYGTGDFYRTFRVSEKIDTARITAEYENGVLTLHLPKVEAVKPRKITVQAR